MTPDTISSGWVLCVSKRMLDNRNKEESPRSVIGSKLSIRVLGETVFPGQVPISYRIRDKSPVKHKGYKHKLSKGYL